MTSVLASGGPRMTGTYTFSSQPRALPSQRRRYREEEPIHYGNIMYDRRVIRGNTYALRMLPVNAQPDPIELHKQQEAHRKALARRRAKEQLQPRTPEPVEGRKHVDVQTELYLEELSDRVVEIDMECQTDAFLDRPPTPLFIPAKTGKDIATQIEEGELFDFDIEVKPMLEVLVGKTIEQALLEVMEEEELANLRALQYSFEELRNAELAEVQRLEEQERRHKEEKERRKNQQMEVMNKQNETSEKIAARAFAQRYLADLLPSVFGNLRDSGYFYDPVERDIEAGFLPWLMNEVEKTMEYHMVGRTVLDMLICEVVEKRLNMFENGRLQESTVSQEGEDSLKKTSEGEYSEDIKESEEDKGSLEKLPFIDKEESLKQKESQEAVGSTKSLEKEESQDQSGLAEKSESLEKEESEDQKEPQEF
ncbi:radial spoke head protein 3 homolog isoform X2 [Ornithorhynchus anatinus]|uniref:radial spoke head protein 3 homolog isoform X2 n=1 Tax=Ornithorhynchus anatinus TaxID=9258 RepID=UPI0019D4AE9E|nr:radial spoke head protein 3 homolog isoform X2 [Ornithorhynchus anatinus]